MVLKDTGTRLGSNMGELGKGMMHFLYVWPPKKQSNPGFQSKPPPPATGGDPGPDPDHPLGSLGSE